LGWFIEQYELGAVFDVIEAGILGQIRPGVVCGAAGPKANGGDDEAGG